MAAADNYLQADCKSRRSAEVYRGGAGLPNEDGTQYGSRPADSIGLRGGSYCRRPDSVAVAFHQSLLSFSPTKNVKYTTSRENTFQHDMQYRQ